MDKYLECVDSIQGWFRYNEFIPILEKVNKHQERGNVLEIGVHHGKSFIPLVCLLKDGEKAVAVDVFENQEFNYDKSGKGDYNKFMENLNKVFEDKSILDRVVVVKKDSSKVKKEEYKEYVNNEKYRIISIDGCHTKKCVFIDLINANASLSDDGIILVNDYLNYGWMGVKVGVDAFLKINTNLRAIYINAYKIILCKREMYDKYIEIFKNFQNNRVINYENECLEKKVWKKHIH